MGVSIGKPPPLDVARAGHWLCRYGSGRARRRAPFSRLTEGREHSGQAPTQARLEYATGSTRGCDRPEAPWAGGAITLGALFDLCAETQRAPDLCPGDVVILDNLSSHNSPGAAVALRGIGAWSQFLPPCSGDLNPIEMALPKPKALLRKAAARIYDQLWQAAGRVGALLEDEECYNVARSAGHETD